LRSHCLEKKLQETYFQWELEKILLKAVIQYLKLQVLVLPSPESIKHLPHKTIRRQAAEHGSIVFKHV
jgi:hypothetical protein